MFPAADAEMRVEQTWRSGGAGELLEERGVIIPLGLISGLKEQRLSKATLALARIVVEYALWWDARHVCRGGARFKRFFHAE